MLPRFPYSTFQHIMYFSKVSKFCCCCCCIRLSHMLNRRCGERRGALVCMTAVTWSKLKSGVATPGSRAEGHRPHVQQSGCKKRHIADTGKWVTHQTHDKDKSKREIIFNENLWRANKLIMMLVHLSLLLCQSFKDSAGECLSEVSHNLTDQY